MAGRVGDALGAAGLQLTAWQRSTAWVDVNEDWLLLGGLGKSGVALALTLGLLLGSLGVVGYAAWRDSRALYHKPPAWKRDSPVLLQRIRDAKRKLAQHFEQIELWKKWLAAGGEADADGPLPGPPPAPPAALAARPFAAPGAPLPEGALASGASALACLRGVGSVGSRQAGFGFGGGGVARLTSSAKPPKKPSSSSSLSADGGIAK